MSGATLDSTTSSHIKLQSALSFIKMITATADPFCPTIHTTLNVVDVELEQGVSAF
jgi:hypothetical protein